MSDLSIKICVCGTGTGAVRIWQNSKQKKSSLPINIRSRERTHKFISLAMQPWFGSNSKGKKKNEKKNVFANCWCGHKSYFSIDFLIFANKSTIFRGLEDTEMDNTITTAYHKLLTFLYARCLHHRQTVGRYKSNSFSLSLYLSIYDSFAFIVFFHFVSFVVRAVAANANFIFILCRMDHSSHNTHHKCSDFIIDERLMQLCGIYAPTITAHNTNINHQ